jgi:RNA polymerase sigma factor (sigma-70 family)
MMRHHHLREARSHEDDCGSAAAHRRLPPDARKLKRTVRAAASCDDSAWTTLMDRFGARVRRVARTHGLRTHDVEDVAQATWLHLFEHIGDVREPAAIGGWLETTARRESLRVLRRGSREDPTDIELVGSEPVEPVNERRLIATERRNALRAGVEKLPGRQRELMTMMLVEPPAEYEEISRLLGIPKGSIGPTRQRGLARLRENRALVALCLDEAA